MSTKPVQKRGLLIFSSKGQFVGILASQPTAGCYSRHTWPISQKGWIGRLSNPLVSFPPPTESGTKRSDLHWWPLEARPPKRKGGFWGKAFTLKGVNFQFLFGFTLLSFGLFFLNQKPNDGKRWCNHSMMKCLKLFFIWIFWHKWVGW